MAGGFNGLLDLVGPSVSSTLAAPATPARITAPRRASGTIPSLVSGPERRGDISKRSGEANAQDLAFGWGDPQNGNRVGKMNAVWAFLNVSAGDGIYDVAHALGNRSIGVELWGLRYPDAASPIPGATIHAVRESEWTETVCKISVAFVSGVPDGCTAVLIVKGR